MQNSEKIESVPLVTVELCIGIRQAACQSVENSGKYGKIKAGFWQCYVMATPTPLLSLL